MSHLFVPRQERMAAIAIIALLFSSILTQGPATLTVLLVSPSAYSALLDNPSKYGEGDSPFEVSMREHLISRNRLRFNATWLLAVFGFLLYGVALGCSLALAFRKKGIQSTVGIACIMWCLVLAIVAVLNRGGTLYPIPLRG